MLRRDDPFGEIRWFEIDPCYIFHVANAFDDANSIAASGSIPGALADNGGFDQQAVIVGVAD